MESDSSNFNKLLLGPGPSTVPERILKAMANQTISHLDPEFFKILDETSENLRLLFETKNEATFAVSGTGSAGMETVFANLIEKNDKVLIFNNGLFGDRMADVAARYGGDVLEYKKDWGTSFKTSEMINQIDQCDNLKIVAIVHAETSTGVLQDIKNIGNHLKDKEILFVVDAVTSFTGAELKIDDWGIDVCYSGTQKCLNVPPGLSPITFNDRSLEKITKRKSKVVSWYLDLNLLQDYLGSNRIYHHTAPVNMLFALNEGLKICLEEGLNSRITRHNQVGKYFDKKLKSSNFKPFVKPDESKSLPMLKSLILPKDVDDSLVRLKILNERRMEIGGGLGNTKGKIWRVGLMGCNAKNDIVDLFFETTRDYL